MVVGIKWRLRWYIGACTSSDSAMVNSAQNQVIHTHFQSVSGGCKLMKYVDVEWGNDVVEGLRWCGICGDRVC